MALCDTLVYDSDNWSTYSFWFALSSGVFCFCVWTSFIGAVLSVIKVYRRFASARPTPQPCVPILMVRQSKKISLEMKKQTNKGTKTTTKRGKYLLPWIDRLCGRDLRKSWCQKERHFFHHSCTGPENNKITIRRCLYGKKLAWGSGAPSQANFTARL